MAIDIMADNTTKEGTMCLLCKFSFPIFFLYSLWGLNYFPRFKFYKGEEKNIFNEK